MFNFMTIPASEVVKGDIIVTDAEWIITDVHRGTGAYKHDIAITITGEDMDYSAGNWYPENTMFLVKRKFVIGE
jgi:hypothetical protein